MNPKDLIIQGLFKVNPYWDEIPWSRKLDRAAKSKGVYVSRTKKINNFHERPVHVVIVPQHGPSHGSYSPGNWNFYFEAEQTLVDSIGASAVSVLDIPEGETTDDWHRRLIDHVSQMKATHILTHIESDPANNLENWTWDQVMMQLIASGWDGALLGVSFDSAFKWIRARSRRLARISPQFVAVDICMPMTGELVRGRKEVGPVNMPVSGLTLELVAQEISDVPKEFDVSFIGALYPYRVELIEEMRALGIKVAVNPHRSDETADFLSSRNNQPSWLQYMRGLASSHMTINFSQSSAGPFEQLKTRVIEAALAGTFLLTDDKDRTRLFFEVDEYATFSSVGELPKVIESLLSDRIALSEKAARAQSRAMELAVSNFWNEIDSILSERGLPSIYD
jgi:hypothetical protein